MYWHKCHSCICHSCIWYKIGLHKYSISFWRFRSDQSVCKIPRWIFYNNYSGLLVLQVGSNGLLSFRWPYNLSTNSWFSVRGRDYLIAPFWDLVYGGRLLYEIYMWVVIFWEKVNTFLQIKRPSNFNGTWILVAYWNAVQTPFWPVRYNFVCWSYLQVQVFLCI